MKMIHGEKTVLPFVSLLSDSRRQTIIMRSQLVFVTSTKMVMFKPVSVCWLARREKYEIMRNRWKVKG